VTNVAESAFVTGLAVSRRVYGEAGELSSEGCMLMHIEFELEVQRDGLPFVRLQGFAFSTGGVNSVRTLNGIPVTILFLSLGPG